MEVGALPSTKHKGSSQFKSTLPCACDTILMVHLNVALLPLMVPSNGSLSPIHTPLDHLLQQRNERKNEQTNFHITSTFLISDSIHSSLPSYQLWRGIHSSAGATPKDPPNILS